MTKQTPHMKLWTHKQRTATEKSPWNGKLENYCEVGGGGGGGVLYQFYSHETSPSLMHFQIPNLCSVCIGVSTLSVKYHSETHMIKKLWWLKVNGSMVIWSQIIDIDSQIPTISCLFQLHEKLSSKPNLCSVCIGVSTLSVKYHSETLMIKKLWWLKVNGSMVIWSQIIDIDSQIPTISCLFQLHEKLSSKPNAAQEQTQ